VRQATIYFEYMDLKECGSPIRSPAPRIAFIEPRKNRYEAQIAGVNHRTGEA